MHLRKKNVLDETNGASRHFVPVDIITPVFRHVRNGRETESFRRGMNYVNGMMGIEIVVAESWLLLETSGGIIVCWVSRLNGE